MGRDSQPIRSSAYGPQPDQRGDLYLPAASHPAVVCLIHGGFWRERYRRDGTAAVAEDLADRGFAVWNLEYRRVGASGGGWPATLADVATGLDHLATLADAGVDIDLDHVITVGHSAGGQLALWAAARDRSGIVARARVRVSAAVGLAPVSDLRRSHALGLGSGAADDLLGGPPDRHPDRCSAASPVELLPLGIPQAIVHCAADDTVPIGMSRDYVRAAAAAGDEVRLVELRGGDHMDHVDARSRAHAALVRVLASLTGS